MTGPYHYKRVREILAEIEATNAVSNETDTTLAIQALNRPKQSRYRLDFCPAYGWLGHDPVTATAFRSRLFSLWPAPYLGPGPVRLTQPGPVPAGTRPTAG